MVMYHIRTGFIDVAKAFRSTNSISSLVLSAVNIRVRPLSGDHA